MPACLTGARGVSPAVDQNMKNAHAQLDFQDILWLRRAATKAGANQVPPAIAEKLVAAGLIETSAKPPGMKITEKGRIALAKLG
jgi:hypothetical protein